MVLKFLFIPLHWRVQEGIFYMSVVGMRHDRIQARIERTPAGAGEVLGRR
jgi:hypothetical protein